MVARSRFWNVAEVCALVMCLASDSWAAVTRLPLQVAGRTPGASSLMALQIGAETRPLFAASGRRVLAIQPADVSEGGRLFAYGPVPPDAATTAPAVPTRPQDLKAFEQDLNRFMQDAATQRGRQADPP